MLTFHHIVKHKSCFEKLARAGSAHEVRCLLGQCRYRQLRALLLLVASVFLMRLQVPDEVRQDLITKRKGFVLRKHFGTWKKVKRLLATRNAECWREVLEEISPILPVLTRTLFSDKNA